VVMLEVLCYTYFISIEGFTHQHNVYNFGLGCAGAQLSANNMFIKYEAIYSKEKNK
jgi:hypothetical protein